MINQDPKLSLTDLWGPLWSPMQWLCFADDDAGGTGGGSGDAKGDFDENGDDKEDLGEVEPQSDETPAEKEAKAEQEKQDEAVTKDAVDISKQFDEKLDAENDLDDDKAPSGDNDNKGDEKDAAQKAADDKVARENDEKDDSETDDKEITDELLERAVKVGYNLTEAKSFSSAKALTKTLEIVEKSQASAGNQASDDKTGKTGTENKDDDKKNEFKPFEVKPFEVKFEDDGDNAIDPEIAKNIKAVNEQANEQMKAMNDHYSEQFKNMAEQLQNANTQMQGFKANADQQGLAKFEAEFETMIAGLDKEYDDLVGKGTGSELGKDSSQMVNRNKLIVAMKAIDTETIKAINAGAATELMPQKEVFKQATAMVFSDKTKELATKQVAAKVKARSKQAIHRASGTQGKALTPHEGAVQTSKEFDAKLDAAEG